MRDLGMLLALPTNLLVLLATVQVDAQELAWPYNLPRTVKYYPEDAAHMKRALHTQQRLAWETPAGMRKMSGDEGEKFFLHYWDFGEATAHDEESQPYANNSIASPLAFPPIAQHTDHDRTALNLFGRSIFTRDFQCPANTTSCSSSDLCCPTGQDCVTIADSVCCCPAGETCSESCGTCDTTAGYTSCPNSSNGGCCIPGAACEGSGCVFYGTQTTVVTLPTSTVTSGVSSSASNTETTTQIAPVPAPTSAVSGSGYTTTVTVTQSVSGGMTTITSPTTVLASQTTIPSSSDPVSSSTPGTLTCTSGFQSCAASLGGGCCPDGQSCGTSNLCLDSTTSTIAGVAPIRPTSVSTTETSISAATAASSTTPDPGCPTGFYMCSAYYMGGCCRVGRDCDTTSCPTTDSTAVVSSGATIVVPYTSTSVVGGGATTAAQSQGSCANGWFSCDAAAGGGCCPSGYLCGSSCTATVSGQQNTGKEAPSEASVVRWAWSFLVVAVGSGIGMVWL